MKNFFKKTFSALLSSAMIICALLGSVSTASAASKLAGDVNKDNKVDNKDVVALFRFLSCEEDGADIYAADTNGDGKRNNKDVTALFRHLSDSEIKIYRGMPNVYTEWDDSSLSLFTNPKQTTVSLSGEGIRLKFAKSGSQIDPIIYFNIAKYAKTVSKPELSGKDGSYIVLKVKSNTDGYIEVFTHSPAAGDSSSTVYKADGQYHYVIVDMTKTTFTTPEKLSTVRIDWAGGDSAVMKSGVSMTISEIGFFAELDDALEYAKMTKDEYELDYEKTLSIPAEGDITDYVTSATATVTRTSDSDTSTATLKATKTSIRFSVDLDAISGYNDKYVKKGDYLALRIRVKRQTNATITLQNVTDASGYSVTVSSQTSLIDCSSKEWQGVMFNLHDVAVHEPIIKKATFLINNYSTAGNVEIGGIAVSDNINDTLILCEHPEYCLNYDETLTDNDELASTVLTAEDEDETLKLWFDQSTEKTAKTDTESTGRTGYTVRMAKNESENCQFFLAPQTDLNARVEIEEFKNSNGDTVPFEAFYEYYHNVSNALRPDALPPLTGPVEVKSGNSQGFVIQLTTAADTPAGLYESVIHIYDDNTGKEIKRAAVAVKVWNFELSEKTELRTSFALWSSDVLNSYNWERVDFTDVQVMDNYYEFFLKYRINIMDIPHGLTSSYANRFMSMDRVNTARWSNLDMSIAEDNDGITPVWIDKVIYYPGELDEPRTNEQFAMFKNRTDRIKANTPDYRMVIPFERDCDLTADGEITTFANASVDSIEFMKDYVNIWCPETFSFTTRDLGFISNATFLQSKEQDAKYGTFIDRMNKEVEGGDELWAYVCINPRAPYANWKIDTDGTQTIVSLWQMKEYNVTGMLYWNVNYWKVNYWDESTPWAFPHDGDGILIYSGYKFGLPTPVSTLRLESIRDGIEDYQMLCMLEEALGEEAANEMISRITTSILTYANNDDYIHAVRVLLGDTLEAALAH